MLIMFYLGVMTFSVGLIVIAGIGLYKLNKTENELSSKK